MNEKLEILGYWKLVDRDTKIKGVLTFDLIAGSIEKFSGLEMVNSLGQVCVRTSITIEFTQIDTKSLNAGLYTLIVNATDGSEYRSKVLVAR